MANNVIRNDVVQIGFEIEDNPLQKLIKEMEQIKSVLADSIGDDAFSDLIKEAKKAQESVEGVGDGAKDSQNKLKTFGQTGFEKLKSGLKTVSSKLTEIANKASGAVFTALKKVAGISFKALGVGLAGAATAIGGVVAKSVSDYAEFEQLKGGVETLFGAKGAQSVEDYAKIVGKSVDKAQGDFTKLKEVESTVLNYANNAFKTAGLSANNYMNTVTSFSASLISSVGGDTKKAADLANMAIVDMSDNANKMGTDMGSLQYAYQGFAKQNYTMLDNLKLGYGGTKTEMQRLIKDASKMKDVQKKLGVTVDATSMSYGNIVKAIHVMQEQMYINGTTQKEAEGTITGSLNMVKAAWGNLMPALIQGGDTFEQCVENLIYSAEKFADNIMPAIEKGLAGAGTLIERLAPKLAEKLPSMLEQFLPPLLKAAGSLIVSLIKALPTIAKSLIPAVKEVGAQIVKALYETFTGKEMSADTFEGIKSAIGDIISFVGKAIPTIIGLAAAFKTFMFVKNVASSISKFAKGVGKIASKVSGGLGGKLTETATGMSKTGNAAKTNSTNMLAAAKSFMMIGAGVLMVAVGFGILAYSSIALANAGGGAIAVMFGLVAALAALGVGMMFMLKSISGVGAQAIPAAGAMMMLGGAVILIAAGFTILAQAAISLAGAGGAAIGVMFGMIAAIAVLVAIVGLFGGALIGGAVGFVIFSAGLLVCAAAALVFALAVEKMTPPLLALLPVVAMVVTTIVNAIGTTLVNVIQTAGEAIRGVLDGVALVFQTFADGVTGIVDSIGNAISGVLDSIAGIFDSIGNAAKNAGIGFQYVADGIAKISEFSIIDLAKSLGAVGDGMATMAKHGEGVAIAGQGMKMIVSALLGMVTAGANVATVSIQIVTSLSLLGTAAVQLSGMLPPLAAALMSMVSPLSTVSVQFIAFSTAAVTSAGASAQILTIFISLTAATNALGDSSKQMVVIMTSSFTKMVTTVTTSGTKMVNTIKQTMQQIVTVIKSVDLSSAGMQMINGLINGMNSQKSAAVSAARQIAEAINKEFDKVQKIASPSKVWEQKGAYMIQGGAQGMQKNASLMQTTAQNVGEMSMPYSGTYTPENSVSYSNSRSSSVEHNSYAPQFNVTFSGASDERTLERQVKRWFSDSMNEMFDGMARRNPRLREV